MSEWKYHIGPATAQMLRDEHGITEQDLIGMRCLVGPVPPGKAYKIVDPPEPPRVKIDWLGMGKMSIRKDALAVVLTDCT